jgi:hypothetical protein
MAMGRDCAAHKHREDVPLEVHHVHPVGDGGPNVKTNRVSVCSNAHGAIHDLLDKGRKVAGGPNALPWLVRIRYGRGVRKLAQAGWDAIHAIKRTA